MKIRHVNNCEFIIVFKGKCIVLKVYKKFIVLIKLKVFSFFFDKIQKFRVSLDKKNFEERNMIDIINKLESLKVFCLKIKWRYFELGWVQ